MAVIMSICASIISGAILFFIQRYFRKKEKQEKQAEARREQKDVLILKSLKSIGKLAVTSAIAVKEGKINGELHKALIDFEETDKELFDFLIHNTAK